jgi:hypothetical protein
VVGLIDPGKKSDIGTVLHSKLEVAECNRFDGEIGDEGMAVWRGWSPNDRVVAHEDWKLRCSEFIMMLT